MFLIRFPVRQYHGMVSHRGSLWVVGGYRDSQYGFPLLRDVLHSADGVRWTPVRTPLQFLHDHQMVVHSVPFAYRVANILVRGAGGDAGGCRLMRCRRRRCLR